MTTGPPKLRVLFLDAGSGAGGSTTSLCYTLRYLDRDAFDPIVAFYFRNSGPDTDRIRALGIPIRFARESLQPTDYVPVSFLLGRSRYRWLHVIKVMCRLGMRWILVEAPQLFRLWALFREERIDVLVLNNDLRYHEVGMSAAILARVPVVCRKAGGFGKAGFVKRLLTPRVDTFVAISEAAGADQRMFNPGTKRLVTIPAGIDLEEFPCGGGNLRVPLDLGIPEDRRLIGSIARFHSGKGQRELVEAAALVIPEYPHATFILVGDGDHRARAIASELRALVVERGLGDHVLLVGWRTDIRDILASLDIFVHCPTTWVEGLGIANLEAMAMAKPSVVSANGGLPDATVDGVTGFIVPPGDVPAMAARILRLLRDPALAARLGRSARERVETEFDARGNTRRIEDVFRDVSSRGR